MRDAQSTLTRTTMHRACALVVCRAREFVASCGLILILSGPLPAKGFLSLCQETRSKAEALVAKCKENARSFGRDFYPSGRGPLVREEHRAWFDTSVDGEHFGVGCVLDGRNGVRFFGMYFALNPKSFHIANVAEFAFVDFNGNVGLRASDGKTFIMLAIHGLTPPREQTQTRVGNCSIPTFDQDTNSTLLGNKKTLLSITPLNKGMLHVRTCYGVDKGIDVNNRCSAEEYYSFLNESTSAVLYVSPLGEIFITQEARLMIKKKVFDIMCGARRLSPVEYSNFIKETCNLRVGEASEN